MKSTRKKVLFMAIMIGCVAAAVPPVKKGPLINGPVTTQKSAAVSVKKASAPPVKQPAPAPTKKSASAKKAQPQAVKPAAKKPERQVAERSMSATAPRAPYRGAIAVDASSGRVLFADNERTTGYPASCTKLMTLLLVLEDLRNGDLQLGRGNIHGGVAGIVRISDTGEHISDRISDLHLVTSCLDLQPLRLL